MSPNSARVLPKPVGIWIRVSTEDQAKGDSPKHHEERARHYAAARGWEVREIYDLAGVSGKGVMEHPETKRMLADVQAGNITGLIFSKLARFSRNAVELMKFSDIFREQNADLISIQENVDTSTPSGRLFYNMVAVMAQWEREEITDRVNSSIKIRAKLGQPLNGRVAFGYHWVNKKLTPHPTEAPVRKLIYELFAQHGRLKTVAKMLNDRGYRTRDGKGFSDTTVKRLIQDSTAKGIHRSNFTKRIAGDKPWALKPEQDWVHHPVEAIVTEELWDRCNGLLENRRVKAVRPAKRAVQLFAGYAICECGQKMYVPTHGVKYTCAKCKNKIPGNDLENIFRDELKNYFINPAQVETFLREANQALSEKTRLLDSTKRELERVQKESDGIYRLAIEGGMTSAQFKVKNMALEERRRQLEAELPKIEAELSLLKSENLSKEYIVQEVQDLHARWPKMDVEAKRRTVECCLEKITIGKDAVDLSLWYFPAFSKSTNGQRTL